MNHHAKAWVMVLGLCVVAGLALVAVGLATGNESLLALGLPLGFLSLILLPVLLKRVSQQQKLLAGENLLADWEYGRDEAIIHAVRQRQVVIRTGWKLALLLTVCTAVILLPISGSLRAEIGAVPVALWLGGAAAIVLIWAAVPVVAAFRASEVKQQPCRTRIGRHCLLVMNHYHPLNDYHKFTLERARLERDADGFSVLKVDCSYVAGKRLSKFRKTVDIPVPAGMEKQAEEVVKQLG